MNHFINDAFVESCKIPKKSKFDLFPVYAAVVGMPCIVYFTTSMFWIGIILNCVYFL